MGREKQESMNNRITPEQIDRLTDSQLFVYGSNIAGKHGAGAAKYAHKKFGASWGRCHGFDNQSYGIPTKDAQLNVLPLERIAKYVQNMIDDARNYPEKTFLVTKIGCGLAGYKPEQIAPLFKDAIDVENVHLPQEFWDVLMKGE